MLCGGWIYSQLNIKQLAGDFRQRVLMGFQCSLPRKLLAHAQGFNLLDRQHTKPDAFGEGAKRQRYRQRHLLVERHARILRAVHPCDLDSTAIILRDIAESLGGITVPSVMRWKRPC